MTTINPPAPAEPIGRSISAALSSRPGRIAVYILVFFWTIPTFGLLTSSFRPEKDVKTTGWWTIFLHPHLTFANYSASLSSSPGEDNLGHFFFTSIKITVPATIISVGIASLAAYALSWMQFKGRDWLFVFVVGMLVVPLQMALIPIFSLYNHLHLFDTVFGLILFHTAFGLPFAIFLLRNFFIGIPKDILESARIDGASEIRIFLRLILPLGTPAIASLAIFQFLWTWNDLLVALTMARNTQPLTVAIFSNLRQFGSNIDLIAPAAFFSLAIPLAVFLAFQRYFAEGLLAGSVK